LVFFSEKDYRNKLYIQLKIKYFQESYGRGRGWAFFAKDFSAEFGSDNIDKALSVLTQQGKNVFFIG
jgi:hypothetical protein